MFHYILLLLLLLILDDSAHCQARGGGWSAPVGNCSLDGGGGKGGHPMIINGEPVPAGEATYQLALFRSGTFICGAALIAPRTAITAGHCVHGFDLTGSRLFSLRYGSLNLTDTSADHVKFVSVLRVTLHPSFTSATFNSDIALLILAERVSLDDTVGLIEIARDSQEVEVDFPAEGSLITVQGWGQTTSQTTSEWLMRAKLTVGSLEQCQRAWKADSQPVIKETMFCAGSLLQSSCKGDSGGPVVANLGGSDQLVGLVSWGSRYCLDERFPNVYARLTGPEVRSWIELNTVQ